MAAGEGRGGAAAAGRRRAPQPRPRRRRSRGGRLLLGLGVALALPALALLGLLGAAQTGWGRAWLEGFVAARASGPGREVRVSGLGGFLPFSVRVGRVAVSDRAGEWLRVERLAFRWEPAALLRGRVRVVEVSAGRLRLDRAPAATEPAVPDEPFSLPSLPRLPGSLPPVELERLAVDSLELGHAVLGEAATFKIAGSVGVEPGGRAAALSLALDRTDEATAEARLGLRLDLAGGTANLELSASETGGLLAAAAGRPAAGDLAVRLAGEGPLRDWRLRLDLEAGGLAAAGADLRLGLEGPPRARVDAEARLAPDLLPSDVAPLVGERPRLTLRVEPVSGTAVRVEALALEGAVLRADGRGTADLRERTVDLGLAVRVPDAAALSGLAGGPVRGALGLGVELEGPFAAPELRVALLGEGLGFADLAAGRARLRLDARPSGGRRADGLPALAFEGRGDVSGLAVGGAAIGAGGGPVGLALAGALPASGPAELRALALEGAGLVARGNGTFDPATREGAARLELAAPSLAAVRAALAAPAPGLPPVEGALRLEADATLAPGGREVRADLALRGAGLAGLPGAAAGLLGPAPEAGARLLLRPGEAAAVEALTFRGQGVEADGRARVGSGAGDRPVEGELEARLPALARAAPGVEGSASLRVAAAGTVARPELRVEAEGRDLAAGGRPLPSLELRAEVAGPLDGPSGRLRLRAEAPGAELSLATGWRLTDGARVLRVEGLELAGPGGTRGSGGLAVDLGAGGLATGEVEARVPDLAALRPLLGEPLTGRLEAAAGLSAGPGGRQDARLSASAAGVRGAFGALRGATLAAEGRDLRGATPAIDATATVDRLATGGAALERARVTAAGGLDRLRVTASLAGEAGGRAIELREAAAAFALAAEPRRATLERLEASVGGTPLRLRGPSTAAVGRDGSLALDRLDVAFGDARLTGRGRLAGGRVDAELALAPAPLRAFAAVGAPPLAGRAEARVTAEGPAASPRVTLAARLRGVAPAGAAGAGGAGTVPPADLDLDATVAGGALEATARVAGLTEQPARAELRLPVRLALQPFALELPPEGALAGRVRGEADLARLGRILALDGQRLAGRLALDVRAAGTLGAPRVTGGLSVAGGLVEDALTGALVRDLELRVAGDGGALRVERLEGRDREQGRLSGRGIVRLAGLAPASIDAGLELRDFELLRGELGTARADVTLALAGTPAASRLSGEVRVDRADIELPAGGGGGGPPTLEVRVRGAPPEPEPGAAGGGFGPAAVALDVRVLAPGRVFVRGSGLESEWEGDLRVGGTAAAPEVAGQLEVRRGFLDLLDRRFVIERGVVDFDGRRPPVPTVDLRSTVRGFEIQAVLAVAGPADDPELELTSEPPLPQDEILARLLFNRSAGRITPAQGVQVAAAIQELRGGGGGGLLGTARRALGVDTLDVTGSGPDDAGVSVGKYLNDRVFLEVEGGVSPEAGGARVEVEIAPNLSANSEVDRAGRTGVQLQWRYDY